jgi:hypothetical protein
MQSSHNKGKRKSDSNKKFNLKYPYYNAPVRFTFTISFTLNDLLSDYRVKTPKKTTFNLTKPKRKILKDGISVVCILVIMLTEIVYINIILIILLRQIKQNMWTIHTV